MFVGQSFITGSYAYGKPGPYSDMDLVVLVTEEELKLLEEQADYDPGAVKEYNGAGGRPLRFHGLNLLCVVDKEKWQCWWDGTQTLKKVSKEHGPISREMAITAFVELRKARGLIPKK